MNSLFSAIRQREDPATYYILWTTHPVPGLRDRTGIELVQADSIDDAEFKVRSIIYRAIKRSVKVAYQKKERKP